MNAPNIRPDCTDELTATLRRRIMVIDGAMGTAIQRDRPDEALFVQVLVRYGFDCLGLRYQMLAYGGKARLVEALCLGARHRDRPAGRQRRRRNQGRERCAHQ